MAWLPRRPAIHRMRHWRQAGSRGMLRMHGRAQAVGLLIGVVVVAAAAQVQGFECAALKPSSSRLPAYASVPGTTRCEGFFEKTVSQPFIELVSLTRGAPPAGLAAAPLELRTDARSPARLVVQPLRASPFYRVDAALAPGQALAWDPAPMLAATAQPVSALGFLALLGAPPALAGALPALAPVAFTRQGLQDTTVYAVVRGLRRGVLGRLARLPCGWSRRSACRARSMDRPARVAPVRVEAPHAEHRHAGRRQGPAGRRAGGSCRQRAVVAAAALCGHRAERWTLIPFAGFASCATPPPRNWSIN